MLIKKIELAIIVMLSILINDSEESDLERYMNLKIEDTPSIKRTDLPSEFSDKTFKIIEDFIKKTKNIDYEILIYFDYIEGEILKCKIGSKSNVKIIFEDDEFKGRHVASIHNHTKDMYTPPSDKNFGIFSRDWEDYELIAWVNGLWILTGKIYDPSLVHELQETSSKMFISSHYYCSRKFNDINEINEKCDKLYGKRLSKYINDKNNRNIQLIKKEYNHD